MRLETVEPPHLFDYLACARVATRIADIFAGPGAFPSVVWRGFGLGGGEFRLPVLMALAATFARDRFMFLLAKTEAWRGRAGSVLETGSSIVVIAFGAWTLISAISR